MNKILGEIIFIYNLVSHLLQLMIILSVSIASAVLLNILMQEIIHSYF